MSTFRGELHYLWHILVHKVPFLWRFPQPHHVDLDMDASTALRFHFGEMVLSDPWRAVQVIARRPAFGVYRSCVGDTRPVFRVPGEANS